MRFRTPRTFLLALPVALLSCGGNTAPLGTSSAAVPSSLSSQPALSVGVSDLEFIGPFPNWTNVKTNYGALGDGVADDTAAIQHGLDALRKFSGHSAPVVLYFPSGTYRISATLSMELNAGANIVGADPATTTIVWGGPAGWPMLRTSGSFDTLFTRLTWDGSGSAGIGVAQWWNYTVDRANYQGSIKHIDEVFRNMEIGIFGGRQGAAYGQGDSETLIERVRFQTLSKAGVNVGSFNAFNWWIWDSEFTDCARGVSNLYSYDDNGATVGAGNLLVYRSVFQRSSVADFSIANTGWFSLHHNVSIDSRQFINAAPAGANGGALIVEGNTVLDTSNPVSIEVGNEGPLVLIDNSIRSLSGAAGPVVQLEGSGIASNQSDRDAYSLGNRYTTSPAIAIAGAGGRVLSAADAVVDRTAIALPATATPGSAPNLHRRIFEVSAGASADQIQAVIDTAAAMRLDNVVVHIPAGVYHLDHTVVVPADVRMQIAGDSEATQLQWSGSSPSGTVLLLSGPSYATVRDLSLVGSQSTAIAITKADQAGGRIFIEGSQMAGLSVHGLASTRVDAQSNSGIASLLADASASVIGIGGLGPSYLTGSSNVLVTDSWYEGNRADLVRGDSGNYTYLGGVMAPYSHGVGAGLAADAPAIDLQDFAGQVNIIGANLALPSAGNGIRVGGNAPTSALFFGVSANQPGYFRNAASSAQVGLVMAKIYTPASGASDLPDSGNSEASFVSGGFAQARSVVWETVPYAHVSGATDVRIFRVFTANTAVGLQIDR
jgi:hypothetical protein